MDFYIPKFGKEMYIKDGAPGIKTGFKGEYRAILYGVDGREKSNTGWKPNTLLDQGLMLVRNTDIFGRINVGTSDTPVDISQTGLQGTYLGYGSMGTVTYTANEGPPNYGMVTVEKATLVGGVGTGTIKEFTCSYSSDFNTTGIRVVLDTPIVKGTQDELAIEHRLTFYPQLTDATGVITIGGDNPEDFNYIIRHLRVDSVQRQHFSNLRPPYWGNMNAGDEELVGITEVPTWHNHYLNGYVESIGGTGPGTWYSNCEHFWAVNSELNGYHLRTCRGGMRGMSTNNGTFGMQMRIGRVSDDTSILKQNTHEIYLNWRTYPTRYVP